MKTIALFLLNRALSLFLGELWLFLRETVATYERLDLHPAQKRAMVYELALNHTGGAGLAISDSMLNLGIEAALQTVRDRAH